MTSRASRITRSAVTDSSHLARYAARYRSICIVAGVLAAAAGPAHAQRFHRSVGFTGADIAYSIEQTADRGWITVGRTGPSTTAPADILITRYDDLGNDVWTRIIGSSNQQNDVAHSVRQLDDGGFIIGAESNSLGGLGIILIRLRADSSILWARAYAGTAFIDAPSGVKVRERSDGFAAIGRFQPAVGGPVQAVFMRTDPAGAPILQRRYSVAGVANASISFTDLRPAEQTTTFPPGYHLSGWWTNPATTRDEAVVVRVDNLGNVIWSNAYSVTFASIRADGLENAPGNIVFAGRLNNGAGPLNGVLARLDTTGAVGAVVWSQIIQSFRPGFAAVANDRDRAILVGGTFTATTRPALLRVDAAGLFTGGELYGDARGEGQDAAVAACGRGYALTGFTTMAPGNGQEDVHLVRTDLNLDTGCRELSIVLGLGFLGAIRTPLQLTPSNIIESSTFPIFTQTPNIGNIRYCVDPGCIADVDDGSGTGTPDGGVGIEDLLYYLSLYANGSLCADVDDGSSTGTPDGGVGIEDLLYYLDRYNAGC